MRIFLLIAYAFWCDSTQATVLSNPSNHVNPTVVDDWSTLQYANGEDGPIEHQGLQIESLTNSTLYNEIGQYNAAPVTGFPDDTDGIVWALNGNTLLTDFLFTFPGEVIWVGLYIRGVGSYQVDALDKTRYVLESTAVVLGGTHDTVVFRGFADLPNLRSIRVRQLFAGDYSTQFDEVQWQLVPEPATVWLLLIGITASTAWRAGYYWRGV
jgi:hypothetical protein